jgi:hypothetical protein
MAKYQATRLENVNSIEDLAELAEVSKKAIIHGVDAQADNDARASFGAAVLAAYSERVGDKSNEVETQLADLLADLRHLCDALGLDYDAADTKAHVNYWREIHGEAL